MIKTKLKIASKMATTSEEVDRVGEKVASLSYTEDCSRVEDNAIKV